MSVFISIITIVRNNADQLSHTLESVRGQYMSPCEHIIVDGESDDDSVEICRKYAASAPYPVKIISRPPKGVYDALNHGIDISTGDVTALLHGGDEYASPEILQLMCREFELREDVELIYADIVYKKKNGTDGRRYSGAYFTPKSLKWGFMFPHPSMFVRTRLYARHGAYSTHYKVAGDYEWLVRVILNASEPILYMNRSVVRMSSGGVSTRIFNRLFVTPAEKWLALRRNGIKVSPLRMLGRYAYVLRNRKI